MSKSKKITGAILGTCIGAQACAALPPLYQTLNEYKALLISPELTEKLVSADAIEDIQRDSSGFIIKTNKHTLKVGVVYDPQTMPGPSKFHFVFNEAIPMDKQEN